MEVTEDKIKVCAYCRVSTDSKDQENSYENQQTYFKNALENNKNCILTNIYPDKGLTGTKLNNRPEFNKMLYDAGIDITKHKKHILYDISNRQPLFNEIWIKNTSRFARNTLSFEIITALRNKGVHIKFIEQNINTKDIGADFLLKLFQVFDEQDSRDKSIKVKTGIKEGARKGVINANSKLYGYNYIQEENRLEIIPEEAEIIKKIFELYSIGYGARRIINYLKDRNVNTRKGKDFVKSTIIRIISNEKYAGINARMKYDTGTVLVDKHYPKVKDKKYWMIIDSDKIPEIVEKELFDKCQEIRNGKINTINQKGIYKGYSEYVGLIKCGKCGNSYTRNSDRGKVLYNCSNRKRKGLKVCDNPNISLEDIEEKIEYLCNGGYKKEVSLMIEFYISLLEKIKSELEMKIDKNTDTEVKQKTIELEKLMEGLDRIIDLYQNLEIDKESYNKRSSDLKFKIDVLNEVIKSLSKTNEEIFSDINMIDNAIVEAKNVELKDIYSKTELLNEIKFFKVVKEKKYPFDKNIRINDDNKYFIYAELKKFNENLKYNNKPELDFVTPYIEIFGDLALKYLNLL